MKYRKKPVVIEAVQWTGSNRDEIKEFVPEDKRDIRPEGLVLFTLEGHCYASFDDWIIKGVKGEFYPCKPDIFEMTYEKVEA